MTRNQTAVGSPPIFWPKSREKINKKENRELGSQLREPSLLIVERNLN